MNIPKNSIGSCYALARKLDQALLWLSSPLLVQENRAALVGLLNLLFNEAKYLDGLLTAGNPKQSRLVPLAKQFLTIIEFSEIPETPWPE